VAKAITKAIREHQLLGDRIAVWKNGRAIWQKAPRRPRRSA